MSSIPIYIVESFTARDNEAYTGSAIAVCVLPSDDWLDDEIKERISFTLNSSNTVFLSSYWTKTLKSQTQIDPEPISQVKILKRCIRWYTGPTEAFLCGVGTFAAVKILSSQNPTLEKVEFESKFRGQLTAEVKPIQSQDSKTDEIITLNFPVSPAHPMDIESNAWLHSFVAEMLGPLFVENCRDNPLSLVEDIQYSTTTSYLLIRLKRQEEEPRVTIRRVRPNFEKALLVQTDGLYVRGITLTIEGDKGIEGGRDFYSRQFFPLLGLNEDPVCGAAHTVLTSYWDQKLKAQGKIMKAHQASKRSGDFLCQLEGERVKLGGRGRIVLEGKLNLE